MTDIDNPRSPQLSGLQKRLEDARANPESERKFILDTLKQLREDELDNVQQAVSKHERMLYFRRAKDWDTLVNLYTQLPNESRLSWDAGELSDPKNTLSTLWNKGVLTPIVSGLGYGRTDLSTLPFDNSSLPVPTDQERKNYAFGGEKYYLGGHVIGFEISLRSIHSRISGFLDEPNARGHSHSVKLLGKVTEVQTDDSGRVIGNSGKVRVITFDQVVAEASR